MIPIKITTKSNTPKETHVKAELESLLDKYDVSKYSFSEKVIVETGVVPHSHPIITINERTYPTKEHILLLYIHEQLHWYLEKHKNNVEQLIGELKKSYKNVPVGFPDGARDEYSTYLHLVLCPLEYKAAKDLFGDKTALVELKFLQTDHYRWIYQTVEKDYIKLIDLLKKHSLYI